LKNKKAKGKIIFSIKSAKIELNNDEINIKFPTKIALS
jgi:hypothetical protein